MSKYTDKRNREFVIFQRLLQGEFISVRKLAEEYDVSSKSISRDICELKNRLSDNWEHMAGLEIQYSYQEKAYYLELDHFISSKELTALVKILIASRSLGKDQMQSVIHKLESFMSAKDRQLVHALIEKEMYHYIPVGADCENVMDNIWSISQSIREQKEISIEYYKMDRSKIFRRVKPLSIVFSEYYFYLIAAHTLNDKDLIRFYRMDRIIRIEKHRANFHIKYGERFDEGELKNRIQYMWPGQETKRTITFEFQGPSVQAVLDRLPGAEVIRQEDEKYIIQVNVYGDGIKMFLLSQGAWVKVLEPPSFVEEMRQEIIAMNHHYKNQ